MKGSATSHKITRSNTDWNIYFFFLIYLIPLDAQWPLGLTQPLTEMSTRFFLGSKVLSGHITDNLITICQPIVCELLASQHFTNLEASKAFIGVDLLLKPI
jgi:hypothetical protein